MTEPTELLFSVEWNSEIPSEIRLFSFGENPTKKGTFIFDEQAAESVMDRFRDQGMDRLPFDAGHGMLAPNAPPDAHRALGWFVPVIKDDISNGGGLALFASEIQWTEAGAEALQKREFRFFSPAITYDPDSRRITSLINVALTNIPATKNQRPLVLDQAGSEPDETPSKENQSMKEVFVLLGVQDEAAAVARVAELNQANKAGAERIAALEDETIKLHAQLAEIEKKADADRRKAKIDGLVAEGRLTPAHIEFASTLSAEQLDKFAATLSASPLLRSVEEPANSGKVETLSDVELQAAKALGMTVKEFEAAKAAKEIK